MEKIIEKTTVDTKGRVMIPTSIRRRWGIKEGVVILFEEKDTEILLKPERKKGVRLKDLCGLSPKRTGEPKWITPEEIKSIWEQIHEAYHTLVYAQKWGRRDAIDTLNDYIDLDTTLFLNQTKAITKLGLYIGLEYGLGGRDCLILANFLSNNIEWMVTFDRALFNLGELSIDEKTIRVIHPGDLQVRSHLDSNP